MKITIEISSLDEFEAWSGGKTQLEMLTPEQRDRLLDILEDVYPEGMTDSELNDFLWFEDKLIQEWLGLDEDGNEIGSEEWAKNVIEKCLKEDDYLNFDEAVSLSDNYFEVEFTEGDFDDKDDLIDSFKDFCFQCWKGSMVLHILGKDPEANEEGIEDWIDDNYDQGDILCWENFECYYDDFREDEESWNDYMNPKDDQNG